MKKTVLIAIIFLAFILRFWRLDTYPALNADEAAIGYNAYSLIQTGRDEHGNPWPIDFQSFNDYKPGLYFYLVLPFIRVLGLSEWAVRIPGAFLGVMTVLVVYLLVKELFNNEKLALISSFFLAISPWHIHFSRGGWEVNVSTFFMTTGVWLFLKGLKSSRYLIFSAIVFALSFYTYHAARIVVPEIGVGLFILFWKEIKGNLKGIFIAGTIFIIVLLPLAKDLLGGNILSRAAGVGLFADPGPLNRINEQRGEHGNYQGALAKVLHNKAVNYSLAFLENWGKHYWGEFLFLSGDDIQRDKVPETGQMYLFDIILLGIGVLAIIKYSKGWGIIVWWLVAAPTAAALTFQSPHALRAENMVIPLVIISAFGFVTLLSFIEKYKSLKIPLYLVVFLLIAWNFARYEHMYWVHMDKEYPYSSQYGVKELVSYVKDSGDKYSKIWVTDRYDQPYILFLFYLKYPPEKFQGHHNLTPRDNFGFSTVRDFDKFHFEAVNFDRIKPENPNSLIIGTSEEIPKEANIVKKIYGTNGFQYFSVVAN